MITRRNLLTKSAAAFAGIQILPRSVFGAASANERINIAFIGAGGKGWHAIQSLQNNAMVNFVAFADVDERQVTQARKTNPAVPFYRDFRVMLEKLGKTIDGVIISTPDHTHHYCAKTCMLAGKTDATMEEIRDYFLGQTPVSDETGFLPLFDEKTLNGWMAAKSTGVGNWGDFTVNAAETSIHVYAGKEEGSKQVDNRLNTEKEYSHYILKLEYKWGGKRFAPRADWDRDAGLLFHVHGDLQKVWPASLEMQIGETPGDAPAKGRRFHSGDLFVLAGNAAEFQQQITKFK